MCVCVCVCVCVRVRRMWTSIIHVHVLHVMQDELKAEMGKIMDIRGIIEGIETIKGQSQWQQTSIEVWEYKSTFPQEVTIEKQ